MIFDLYGLLFLLHGIFSKIRRCELAVGIQLEITICETVRILIGQGAWNQRDLVAADFGNIIGLVIRIEAVLFDLQKCIDILQNHRGDFLVQEGQYLF